MNTTTQYKRIIILMAALLLPLCAQARDEGIRVEGTSKVSVTPDTATFMFAVEDRGKDLSSVKHSVDDKTAKLIDLCKRMGVDPNRITASQVYVHPQHDFKTRTFLGYNVSRDITIVLDDLGKYSKLVEGAISSGVTTIRSVTLDTSRRDELKLKALAAAVSAAKEKAIALAKSSGIALGKVLSIDEGGTSTERPKYRGMQTMATANENGAFEPGRITVSATVTVTYAIK